MRTREESAAGSGRLVRADGLVGHISAETFPAGCRHVVFQREQMDVGNLIDALYPAMLISMELHNIDFTDRYTGRDSHRRGLWWLSRQSKISLKIVRKAQAITED